MGEVNSESGYNWREPAERAEGELRGWVNGCGLVGVVTISVTEETRGRYENRHKNSVKITVIKIIINIIIKIIKGSLTLTGMIAVCTMFLNLPTFGSISSNN